MMRFVTFFSTLLFCIGCAGTSLKNKKAPYEGPKLEGEWQLLPKEGRRAIILLNDYSSGMVTFSAGAKSGEFLEIRRTKDFLGGKGRDKLKGKFVLEATSKNEALFKFTASEDKERIYGGDEDISQVWQENKFKTGESVNINERTLLKMRVEHANNKTILTIIYDKILADNVKIKTNRKETYLIEKIEDEPAEKKVKPRPTKFKGYVFSISKARKLATVTGFRLNQRLKTGEKIRFLKNRRHIGSGIIQRLFHTKALVKVTSGLTSLQHRDVALAYK